MLRHQPTQSPRRWVCKCRAAPTLVSERGGHHARTHPACPTCHHCGGRRPARLARRPRVINQLPSKAPSPANQPGLRWVRALFGKLVLTYIAAPHCASSGLAHTQADESTSGPYFSHQFQTPTYGTLGVPPTANAAGGSRDTTVWTHVVTQCHCVSYSPRARALCGVFEGLEGDSSTRTGAGGRAHTHAHTLAPACTQRLCWTW